MTLVTYEIYEIYLPLASKQWRFVKFVITQSVSP